MLIQNGGIFRVIKAEAFGKYKEHGWVEVVEKKPEPKKVVKPKKVAKPIVEEKVEEPKKAEVDLDDLGLDEILPKKPKKK